MDSREELFERLLELFTKHIEATDALTEWEIEKLVYWTLKDSRTVDLDFDLKRNQVFS